MRYLKTDAMGKHEILDGDDVHSNADAIKKFQTGDPEARKAFDDYATKADVDAKKKKKNMTPEDMSLGCHYLRTDAMGRHEILDGRRRR
jgi:hypothetical protein